MDELREKLAAILSDYFEVGGDCYHYILERVKYAELTPKDFREYNEDDVAEIAEYLVAEGVTVQRWIPVTERLPDKEFWEHQKQFEDEDLEVLVMIKGAKLPTALFYNAEGEFYEHSCDGQTFYIVTHWMPKPEPPKEVQK